MPNAPDKPWIFIVDEGGGRLLHARTVPPGRLRLEVKDHLKNEWKEHEHGRPTGLSRTEVGLRKTGVSKTKYQFAQPHHEDEEFRHQFAKEVTQWLEKRIRDHKIERLAVIAPAKVLGELRDLWPKAVQPMIEEHEQDLSWIGEGDLVKHPAIAQLLENEPG